MWNGECTIYNSPHYPRGCDSYKCKLFRELLDESVSLPKALRTVKRAKEKIKVVEKYLPASKSVSFRERMVKRLERINSSASLDARDAGFQSKAAELLYYFDKQFGVNDFLVLQETL